MDWTWDVKSNPITNGSKLFESFDVAAYQQLSDQFRANDEFTLCMSLNNYIKSNGGPELTPLRTNYKKLYDEITGSLKNDIYREILMIGMTTQEYAIMDLLASLENVEYIKTIYKIKKSMVASGLNTTEATVLIDCIRQGRSLLQAGKQAAMLAKPLIDFYAASAYAYAIIVLNSPLHHSTGTLKGSHGHSYNHSNKAIDIGGTIPSGTFLDLLCAIPVTQINNGVVKFKYSILDAIEYVQNHSISISLLALLSMVPELQNHYRMVDNKHKLTHQLQIRTEVINNKVNYTFSIGDGITKPSIENIKKCFNSAMVGDCKGCYQVSIPAEQISQISPMIFQDMSGKLWYIESPIEGLILPEICLHFLIISAFCNIMRYSPQEWSNILFNKTSSEFSLLVSRYLRLFEQKFPLLATMCLTNYLPILETEY